MKAIEHKECVAYFVIFRRLELSAISIFKPNGA